jgi:predicted N-acetyltransferase YhbS
MPAERIRSGIMITIRQERTPDQAPREALLDRAYGAVRFKKPSQKIRAGHLPAEGLAFVATDRGRVVGTVRLWNISAGGKPALLLGPLAVHPDYQGRGLGSGLMSHAIESAKRLGHKAVLLVGDAPYYGRFGFRADSTGNLRMPGPFEQKRLLAIEFETGALDGAQGMIVGTGPRIPRPAPSTAPARRKPRAA